MVDRAETFHHPADEIIAAFDLLLVEVRLVMERAQLLGKPMGLGAVAFGVADEDIRHVLRPQAAPLVFGDSGQYISRHRRRRFQTRVFAPCAISGLTTIATPVRSTRTQSV